MNSSPFFALAIRNFIATPHLSVSAHACVLLLLLLLLLLLFGHFHSYTRGMEASADSDLGCISVCPEEHWMLDETVQWARRNLVKRWQPALKVREHAIHVLWYLYYISCAMLNGAVVRICMVFDISDKCAARNTSLHVPNSHVLGLYDIMGTIAATSACMHV